MKDFYHVSLTRPINGACWVAVLRRNHDAIITASGDTRLKAAETLCQACAGLVSEEGMNAAQAALESLAERE